MTIHYNWYSQKRRRKKLREESTPAEIILWNHLREKKLDGEGRGHAYSAYK